MTDVRCIYSPDRFVDPATIPDGGAVPSGSDQASREVRNRLGRYLEEHLPRPVFLTDQQADTRVSEALRIMTHEQRVLLEIDMTQETPQMHAYDYDPLPFGSR